MITRREVTYRFVADVEDEATFDCVVAGAMERLITLMKYGAMRPSESKGKTDLEVGGNPVSIDYEAESRMVR